MPSRVDLSRKDFLRSLSLRSQITNYTSQLTLETLDTLFECGFELDGSGKNSKDPGHSGLSVGLS